MLFLQLLINGLIRGGIYALVAIGFALIYRGARVFHIAHGGVYTAAAYSLYLSYTVFHLPFNISIFLSFLVTIVLGVLCELLVYAPLTRKQSSPAVIIVSSIGLYIIIVNFIALIFGNETKIIFPGVSKTYSIREIVITQIQMLQFIFSIITILATMLILNNTRYGISIKALANNPQLSEALGFDIRNIRIFIFVVGSLLVSIAAILIASDVGMDPWGGISMLLSGVVAMIVGGMQFWEGAVLGSFLLGTLQALAIWQLSARWQDTVTFALLILFLLFRPQGILGRKVRLEEV